MHSAAYPAAVAYRLRLARTGAGLTKGEMAKALKIPRRKYRKMEKSGVIPEKLLAPICVATRCSATYLLQGRRTRQHQQTVIQHDNLTVRLNPCGAPCTAGQFWCQEGCLADHVD